MLACCPSCHGFVIDLDAACVHCGAAPAPRRRLARFLALRLLGAAATVTLMACYGMTYECEETGTCDSYCESDYDCVTGQYCNIPDGEAVGVCAPGGTCADDTQCPTGWHCDEPRSTCVPDDDPGCTTPGFACGEGSRCDVVTRECVPCEGTACGSCLADATCVLVPPACPPGTTPAVEGGCYTGACLSEEACAAEACALLDEADCVASATCDPVYAGINCTDPDGDPCNETTADCTCESYVYDRCELAPPPGG